jgi:hypothetical protein
MVEKLTDTIGEACDHALPLWILEKVARAVLKTMSEPTEDMKFCCDEVHWDYSCHMCGGLAEGWRKMHEAALK